MFYALFPTVPSLLKGSVFEKIGSGQLFYRVSARGRRVFELEIG